MDHGHEAKTPKPNKPPNILSRRDFVTRVGGAVGFIGAMGAGYGILSQSSEAAVKKNVMLPHRVHRAKNPLKEIVHLHGENISAMLEQGFKALGGGEQFIPKNSTVLLKPNVGFERPPSMAATTNPDLMHALTRLCLEFGAKRVIVTDHPCNAMVPTFRESKIKEMVELAGGEVYLPRNEDFKVGAIPSTYSFSDLPVLLDPYIKADVVINVPIVKNHSLSKASIGMKGWMGLLGYGRQNLHRNMQAAIAELSELFPATLTVVDGIRVLMQNGPTGGSLSDVRLENSIIMSVDPVASDALAASFLNLKPSDLDFLKFAERKGIGTSRYTSLKFEEITV